MTMKLYEVIKEGFCDTDLNPIEVGEKVSLDPKHGNTIAGLYFKQLRPVKDAKVAPVKPTNPEGE